MLQRVTTEDPSKKNSKSYEVEYELKEDIKVPSRKELQAVGSELMKNDPKFRKDVAEQFGENWARNRVYGGFSTTPVSDTQRKQYDEVKKMAMDFVEKSVENATMDRVYGYVSTSFVKRPGVREKMFNELKRRGYNAIMDEEDISSGARHMVAPMIVFDAEKTMGRTGKKELSTADEIANERRSKTWDQKQRNKNLGRNRPW